MVESETKDHNFYIIDVKIESPGGSVQKFDFDTKTDTFRLTKLLPNGTVFPFDFGFIPDTLGEDGDPLDVLVISEAPTFTGCNINCKLIGCFVATQTERDGTQVRNDRYIAIPTISLEYAKIDSLTQLPKQMIIQLESFFITYNSLAGKKFEITRKIGAKAAMAAIQKAKAKNTMHIKLELMLPLANNEGKQFPKSFYTALEKALVKKFGGLTAYHRTPVEGFWQDNFFAHQPMLVYELFISTLDVNYWKALKNKLEHKFHQKEILIIHSPASKII